MESLVGLDLFESIWIAGLKRHRRCPTQLILLVKIFQATWMEQRLTTFHKTSFTLLIDHVLRHTLLQVAVLDDITVKPKKQMALEKLQEIMCLLLTCHTNRDMHWMNT